MAKTPISVIIPTYNRATLLPESMKSFLSTDYDNVEFIILDNGSSDNTEQVVSEITSSDNRFRYIKNIKNLGLTRSIFRGVLEATHEKIVFFSDEDYISSSFISKIAEVYDKNPEIGAITIGEIEQKSYDIPGFTQKCKKDSDDFGITLLPGIYSAYVSYIKTAYIGCASLDRQYINFNHIPLDNISYPQRWLSSISSFYGGTHIFTEQNLGEFPKYNAKEKGGVGSQRWGDYALSEYLKNADFLLCLSKEDNILSPNDIHKLSMFIYKFVYTKFPSYFRNIAKTGNKEKAYELFKSVIEQERFSRSFDFWRYITIFFDTHYEGSIKTIFNECNQRYNYEMQEGYLRKSSEGYTTFGVKKENHVIKKPLLEIA